MASGLEQAQKRAQEQVRAESGLRLSPLDRRALARPYLQDLPKDGNRLFELLVELR
jgi:hypothetical protein